MAMAYQALLNPEEKSQILQQQWDLNKTQASRKDDSINTTKEDINSAESLPAVFNQKVTLKSEDLPLSVILKPIAQTVKHNIILGVGVQDKKVSINVADATIKRALNTILYSLGYGFQVKNGNLIILAEETRIFRIVLPPVTSQFNDMTSNESVVRSSDQSSSNTSNSTGSAQVKLGTKIIVENDAQEISLWNDVTANLKILVSSAGQFSINKQGGVVIVTDAPTSLERIQNYFDELNRRVGQQIEVDVRVMEVVLNHENRLGVDWNVLANNLKTLNSVGLATNFASGNFTGSQFFTFNAEGSKEGSGVKAGGVRVVIDALNKQGKVEIVSQPRITMLNNQVAVIQVGSTQSFVDHTSLETTQTGTITSVSTSQVQEGVTMRLLGNIVADKIYLSITPVVTTIDNIRSIRSGTTTIEAPQTTTKSINTLVKLDEGQTVAIGGLITSYKEKGKEGVPVLSKLPFIGRLFEYAHSKNNKTELVIFITPRKV